MKLTLLACTFGALLFTALPRAMAASFDCSKAANATETLICKNAKISALDDKLQQTYMESLAVVAPSSKKALIEEQRHWITYTRNVCQDETCLQQTYTARIAVLARNEKDIINKLSCVLPNGGTACTNVVAYRDPSIRIQSFNQSLAHAKHSGKIISCGRLISLPVGTVGSNNRFGGICTLSDDSQRKTVEICDDDMFGHFELQPGESQDVSDKTLIDFTYEHCFGG
ncbi:lysozyme inhibitor LprI family protein [Rhodanobacter hydrolyticus]|uniref:DUF1311 domain-containing protein n=1 Tax=Rhodanobacter hydrolyticus TaxID=2250595 RepID=A0ABW8J5G4_9GAMM